MRLLPWLQEAAKRSKDLVLADCAKCKRTRPASQRQHLGCGFELRIADETLWSPESVNREYEGVEPTVCAGYSTGAPEVAEAMLMRLHWKTGNLATALLGDEATADLMDSIVILDVAYSEVEHFRLTEKK